MLLISTAEGIKWIKNIEEKINFLKIVYFDNLTLNNCIFHREISKFANRRSSNLYLGSFSPCLFDILKVVDAPKAQKQLFISKCWMSF